MGIQAGPAVGKGMGINTAVMPVSHELRMLSEDKRHNTYATTRVAVPTREEPEARG